jgi:MFS family permease
MAKFIAAHDAWCDKVDALEKGEKAPREPVYRGPSEWDIFLATYLFFAPTQNVIVIAALFIFYGVYQGIFRAVGKAFATDFVPEQVRASGVGWHNTTVGLAGLVASIVAGLLWDQIGHSAVFLYGATFAAAGCIALLILIPAKQD